MRGTLSIKDALTDMSPSMWKLDDKYHIDSDSVKGAQYIHKVRHAATLVSLSGLSLINFVQIIVLECIVTLSEFQVNSFLFHVYRVCI